MDGQADSLRVISTSTWKVMGCPWINLWYQLCNRETKENLGECSLHYHSIHETFWYLRTNQTVKQKPHSGWHSGVYMSLGLGHRRAQKLVDEFEIIPYKFFQREPMNFAIGRQLNFLIGLMMIYIYLIWMIFLDELLGIDSWPLVEVTAVDTADKTNRIQLASWKLKRNFWYKI
jgi:hypothetical protein